MDRKSIRDKFLSAFVAFDAGERDGLRCFHDNPFYVFVDEIALSYYRGIVATLHKFIFAIKFNQ